MQVEAAVFLGPDTPLQLERKSLSDFTPGDGEILARVIYSSICGSDLHTLDGRRKEPTPSILGHEGVAEAYISKRQDVLQGDKFTFSVADCCSVCMMCTRGLNQKCHKLFKYGHARTDDGTGLNGCYASHILIRKGTHIVKIPESIESRIFTPVNCALATVMNALENVQNLTAASSPQTALVQGAGLLGIYGCAVLSSRGFTVYCTDVSDLRLSLVSEFGGTPVRANELKTLTQSIDLVLEVCGVKSTVKQATDCLRAGGAYILVGLIHPDSQLDLTAEMIMRKCLTIRGIHNYSPRHLEQAVNFIADTHTKHPYHKLFDPQDFKLENIADAVIAAKSQKYHRTIISA